MGRALTTALALILLSFTCALSAVNSAYVRGMGIAHQLHIPQGIGAIAYPAEASMSVRQIRLSAGYCCNLDCSCAELNNAMAEPCEAMQDRAATLSPSLCAASAVHNSSSMLCPPYVAAPALCNGGPSCCTSCNKSCTSKLDVCACPCNHCSTCSCCKWVENQTCWVRCRPCDKVWMMLDFQDQLGKPHSVNYTCDFSLDSVEAQDFYNMHNVGNTSVLGLYSPDDLTIIHVHCFDFNVSDKDAKFLDYPEDYPVGRDWVAFGIVTAFPIFTVSVILTGLLIALLLQRRRLADQRRPLRIAWSVNRGLWMGIIWPLIIMLLILQVSYFVPERRTGLSMLVAQETALSLLFPQLLACIGWLPLLLLWIYHIIHPQL